MPIRNNMNLEELHNYANDAGCCNVNSNESVHGMVTHALISNGFWICGCKAIPARSTEAKFKEVVNQHPGVALLSRFECYKRILRLQYCFKELRCGFRQGFRRTQAAANPTENIFAHDFGVAVVNEALQKRSPRAHAPPQTKRSEKHPPDLP